MPTQCMCALVICHARLFMQGTADPVDGTSWTCATVPRAAAHLAHHHPTHRPCLSQCTTLLRTAHDNRSGALPCRRCTRACAATARPLHCSDHRYPVPVHPAPAPWTGTASSNTTRCCITTRPCIAEPSGCRDLGIPHYRQSVCEVLSPSLVIHPPITSNEYGDVPRHSTRL